MSSITIFYIFLAAIIAIVMAVLQYYYKQQNKNIVLLALRALSIFGLLLLLINPKIKINKLVNIKPTLNILVDNSTSIKFNNQENNVLKIVDSIKSNRNLVNKFIINYFSFSDDLYQLDSFRFNKPQTNIAKALKSLEKVNTSNISSIILITDGNQTYGDSYEFYKSKNKIFPVIIGDTTHYEDLKISQINTNSFTTLNNNFPVEVFINYDGEKSVFKQLIIEENTKIVYKKNITLSEENPSQKVEFYLSGNSIGIHNYTCYIDNLPDEKNTTNNIGNFSVEVVDEQSKILILSAINHPDIGMFKRSIETNKQRKVFIETNLNKKIQYNDYQLFILYQPTKKFKEIFNKIINLHKNYLVVTGTQTDWDFLNSAQSYFKKNYINKTEDYLPRFNSNFDEFITEDIGFENCSPLEDYFGDIEFLVNYKPILFQSIGNFTTELPMLATFSDNESHSAALFGENSWKWRMLCNVENKSYEKFDTFFNKLILYLSSNDISNPLELSYKSFIYANEDVIIDAQFYDANYVFDQTQTLILTIKNTSDNTSKQLPFTLQNNKYSVRLNSLEKGDYNFTVAVKDKNIIKKGSFKVLPYSIEQQFPTANVKDLKMLASNNGKMYYSNNLNDLISELNSSNEFVIKQKSVEKLVSLVEWKWLLVLIIIFLSAEWFIRKYRGLI